MHHLRLRDLTFPLKPIYSDNASGRAASAVAGDALVGMLAPDLLDLLVAAATPAIVAVADRVLFIIVLVIIFGGVKWRGGEDRGDDRFF